MTRDEYRKQAERYGLNCSDVLFPLLLHAVAVRMFTDGECDAEFATETRRRLRQLEQTGATDP